MSRETEQGSDPEQPMEPATVTEDPRPSEKPRRGDPEGVAEAYRRFGSALYGTALRMLGSPQEAEEVVQEGFVTLLQRAPADPPANLGAWLHRVVANRCIDRIRRRRPEVDAVATGLASAPVRLATALDLEQAVRRLPGRAREVFLLHDVEGLRHREIAQMLGISAGTSKSQLSRARELLRAGLSDGRS